MRCASPIKNTINPQPWLDDKTTGATPPPLGTGRHDVVWDGRHDDQARRQSGPVGGHANGASASPGGRICREAPPAGRRRGSKGSDRDKIGGPKGTVPFLRPPTSKLRSSPGPATKIGTVPSSWDQLAHAILNSPIECLLEHHLAGTEGQFVQLGTRHGFVAVQYDSHSLQFTRHCLGTPLQAAKFRILTDGVRRSRQGRTYRGQQRQ